MQGTQLISALMALDGGMKEYLQAGLTEDHFVGPEIEVFNLVDTHVKKYGTFPGSEVMAGYPLPPTSEVPGYYLDIVRKRYSHTTIATSLNSAAGSLNSGNIDAAINVLLTTLMKVTKTANPNKLVDYATEGDEVLYQNIKSIMSGTAGLVQTGWPSLDKATMGLRGGDVLSVVGRPANGKSFLLLALAMHCWKTQGLTPLFISMEMSPLAIIERLAAIQSDVNLTQIKTAKLTTVKNKSLKATLVNNKEMAPLWVVDGNMSATVEEVITHCLYLRPDIVIIDGAYLLRSSDPKMQQWQKISNNLEMLKGEVSQGLGIPTALSYQFNRDAVKKKGNKIGESGGDYGLDNIGGSDAIGQISSLVLALKQEDTIESKNVREVDIAKGRDGQVGGFNINWQFYPHTGLDFSEVKKEEIADLTNL